MRDRLTVDDVCAHPHISASRRGFAGGALDDALEQIGRSRHVATVLPSCALGALMVLEGDVICLLLQMMAAHLAERGVPLLATYIPAVGGQRTALVGAVPAWPPICVHARVAALRCHRVR